MTAPFMFTPGCCCCGESPVYQCGDAYGLQTIGPTDDMIQYFNALNQVIGDSRDTGYQSLITYNYNVVNYSGKYKNDGSLHDSIITENNNNYRWGSFQNCNPIPLHIFINEYLVAPPWQSVQFTNPTFHNTYWTIDLITYYRNIYYIDTGSNFYYQNLEQKLICYLYGNYRGPWDRLLRYINSSDILTGFNIQINNKTMLGRQYIQDVEFFSDRIEIDTSSLLTDDIQIKVSQKNSTNPINYSSFNDLSERLINLGEKSIVYTPLFYNQQINPHKPYESDDLGPAIYLLLKGVRQ